MQAAGVANGRLVGCEQAARLTSLILGHSTMVPPFLPGAALHLKVHAGVLHDQHSQGGDVDASIALSCQEKFVVLVFRKEAEEVFKGFKIVLGHLRMTLEESGDLMFMLGSSSEITCKRK